MELGYNCSSEPPETDYIPDDDSTDSGSVLSTNSSSFTDWNDQDRTPVCSDEEEIDRLLDKGMKRLQLKWKTVASCIGMVIFCCCYCCCCCCFLIYSNKLFLFILSGI